MSGLCSSAAWLVAAVAALSAGCAARKPQTYRLIPQDRARVLVPPGVAGADTATIRISARAAAWRPECAPSGNALTVRPKGRMVQVAVFREALLKQPAGWLRDWAATTEKRGCMGAGRGVELAERIVESLPLDPSAAHRLLHAGTIQKGYVDLGSEHRLQVVMPIMKAGAADDAPIVETASVSGNDRQIDVTVRTSENLTGVETAWYAIQRGSNAGGAAFVPVGVERRIEGRLETADTPLMNYLRFTPEATCFRLFYKADPGDNGITHVVLAAPSAAELDARTAALSANDALCRTSDPATCAVFPRRVGVNPLLAATVNGREVRLPMGSSVRSAIQTAGGGAADEVVPKLKVFKRFGGKLVPVEFDNKSREILDLVLLGGESLSWQ